MKFTCIMTFLFLFSLNLFARDHLIYSVAEDIPMGYENEIIKKNYYVNIGGSQGVQKGTVLDVYRVISKMNPYDNQKRINYKVKIGELKVVHADDEAAIGKLNKIDTGEDAPLFEVENFMIGDYVSINVND